MSDTATASVPAAAATRTPLWERIRLGATVLGAIAGAVTGLWGVYEKARSEARDDTAASYNTLAPQVNQMGEALKQLQQENQQLREIVAQHQSRPRIAAIPKRGAEKAAETPPATATSPAGVVPPPPAPSTAPSTAIDRAPAGSTAATDAEKEDERDPVSGLLRTVGRTRAAIETLRKVPEDFGHVLENKK